MSTLSTQSTMMQRLTGSPLVKRLLWSALQAGIGALASLASTHLARLIWTRVFGEAPPN
jgi:hypothetical protein